MFLFKLYFAVPSFLELMRIVKNNIPERWYPRDYSMIVPSEVDFLRARSSAILIQIETYQPLASQRKLVKLNLQKIQVIVEVQV